MEQQFIDTRLPLPPTIIGLKYRPTTVDQSGPLLSDDNTFDAEVDPNVIIYPDAPPPVDPPPPSALMSTARSMPLSTVTAPTINTTSAPTGLVVQDQNIVMGKDGSVAVQLVVDVQGSSSDIGYDVRTVVL